MGNDDLNACNDKYSVDRPIKGDIYFDGIEVEGFISSLLAKQQEELRDMLIRKSVAIDMGGISTRIVNLDSALADIKSKLNKTI